ncbi:MAG: hypothetical protein M3318_05015, partial [Actinomycetota bacterium]|nr:hypothetical protein [Actinomycetota bacterium]
CHTGLESLATAGVVREVVSVADLPGMGDGRPLERRVHAKLRKLPTSPFLVAQVEHPLFGGGFSAAV